MKKLLLIFLILKSSLAFSERFHYLVHNSTYEVINVSAAIYKTGATKIINFEIAPKENIVKKIRLNEKERIVFSAFFQSGTNKSLKSVERSYLQMISTDTTHQNNSNPLNINIVEIYPESDRIPVNFGDLLIDITNNKYLNKLLGTTSDMKINNKIELGSFLIYNNDSLLEPFPATTHWQNQDNVKIYNTYSGFQTKRVIKQINTGLNVTAPLIGRLNSGFGNNTMIDYKWYVNNYKEKCWNPKDENPQTIFKKYKDATGFNIIKDLIKSGLDYDQLKIYFVISVSTTDSIKLSSDNFTAVDLNLDMNFNLPPNGSKLVNIGSKGEFYKSSRYWSGEEKVNIYNYFEVMDITTSSLVEILNEINIEKKEEKEKDIFKVDSIYINRIENLMEVFKNNFMVISKSDFNNYNDEISLDLMLSTPLNKIDLKTKTDSLSDPINYQIEQFNLDANTYNAYIDNLASTKKELINLQQEYQSQRQAFISDQSNFLTIDIETVPSTTTKRLNKEEFKSILEYSEENKK